MASAMCMHLYLNMCTTVMMNPLHRMRPVLLLRPPPPLPMRKNAAESSKAMNTETLKIMNYKWAPTAHQ
jgi:hypothetical protein